MGINILSDQMAQQQKIEGVVILTVTPGGPADQAGVSGPGRRRTAGSSAT